MKLILLILSTLLISVSCQSQSSNGVQLVNTHQFQAKMQELKDETLLDVRTPGEYEAGHLANAMNVNWNGNDFEQQVSKLDKNKPVMVYCQAGGRSAAAAAKLESMGFKEVYDMQGGYGTWKRDGMTSSTEEPVMSDLSMQEYQKMVTSDKLVLVDFYTTWCKPCKMMDPHLKAIDKEHDYIKVIKVDAEKNEALSRELKIAAIPDIKLYKKGKLVWSNVGYLGKEELLQKISTFK